MAAEDLENAIPPSFADAVDGHYLGNPEVVTELVGHFCTAFEAALRAKEQGEITSAQFVEDMQALTREHADIFAGRNPDYRIVEGYHNAGLPMKLRADLGPFWAKRHAAWGDDALCVLFEWLAAITAEKLKLAQGDDMLLEVMLKPTVQYVVQVLLGIERRAY